MHGDQIPHPLRRQRGQKLWFDRYITALEVLDQFQNFSNPYEGIAEIKCFFFLIAG